MSTPSPHPDLAASGRRRTFWPNLIWGIPIAALIIVAYLGLQALAHRGILVTVTFSSAAGARAGETKVTYQGVEAGQLVKILPNKDGRRFDFELRLKPEAKPGLNTNARFWLIGASPTLFDISSLKAVVSGVAIGFSPGEGGTPTRHFEGLERAPLILPEDKGTHYYLRARSVSSIHEGTLLLYYGQPIGKVLEVHFNGQKDFRLQVFVFQPFDSLIKEGVRFWQMSPLRLSFGGDGITANLAPISTLLSGGIELESSTAEPQLPPSKPDTEFKLYGSRQAARAGLEGPAVRYEFDFANASSALAEEAPVTLLGFQVGEVESTRLAYDSRTGAPHTIITARLYPGRLGLADVPDPNQTDWHSVTDRFLRHLARLGYRARLQQTPALLGEESIALAKIEGQHASRIIFDADTMRFPTEAGAADFHDVISKADQLLVKLNGIPLQKIGGDLQRAAGRIDAMVSSPQMTESLQHLRSSLASLDVMLAEAKPQIGPLTAKLNDATQELSKTLSAARALLDNQGDAQSTNLPEAIRQLSEAAQSLRTLTDYLSRHPEALLRGKRPER